MGDLDFQPIYIPVTNAFLWSGVNFLAKNQKIHFTSKDSDQPSVMSSHSHHIGTTARFRPRRKGLESEILKDAGTGFLSVHLLVNVTN